VAELLREEVEKLSEPIVRELRGQDGEVIEVTPKPAALCKAIYRGLREEQLESWKCRGDFLALCSLLGGPLPIEEDMPPDVEVGGFWDDVNGGWLPEKLVATARQEEIKWLKQRGVYRVVNRSEAWERTGHAPVTLRWVDTNKGGIDNPFIRCRLVARELTAKTPELQAAELFSAMPPLEAVKLLGSLYVSRKKSKRGLPLKLAFYDISRAHFYGEPVRDIYVELPEEAEEAADKTKCGLLEKSMYGTRDASQRWQDHYTKLFVGEGYRQGTAPGAIFQNDEDDVSFTVHGDDFMVLSDNVGIAHLEAILTTAYDYKCTGKIGTDVGDQSEVLFLGRVFRAEGTVDAPELEIEADQRHVELALEALGLSQCKGVTTPSVKKTVAQEEAELGLPPLPAKEATLFRSVLMRLSYVGQDRPDLGEALKCLSRRMVSPSEADMTRLKRVCRYLRYRPRAVIRFRTQDMPGEVNVEVDSDFAGDLATRRSTGGLLAFHGLHLIRSQSALQSTISLSSGEAEYYAAVTGGAGGLGIQALASDLSITLSVRVGTDSIAGKGLASRRGLGKVRHVSARYLWLQERVLNKDVKLEKIGTERNRSDMLTDWPGRAQCQKGTLW